MTAALTTRDPLPLTPPDADLHDGDAVVFGRPNRSTSTIGRRTGVRVGAPLVSADDADPLALVVWLGPNDPELRLRITARGARISPAVHRALGCPPYLRYGIVADGAALVIAAAEPDDPDRVRFYGPSKPIGSGWFLPTLRRYGWRDGTYPVRPIAGGALVARRDEWEAG